MAFAFITMKVMPESPDVDLAALENKVKDLIQEYTESPNENNTQVTSEPLAFGLKALLFKFAVDEAKGATDNVEEKINALDGVVSVEVVGISRALG